MAKAQGKKAAAVGTKGAAKKVVAKVKSAASAAKKKVAPKKSSAPKAAPKKAAKPAAKPAKPAKKAASKAKAAKATGKAKAGTKAKTSAKTAAKAKPAVKAVKAKAVKAKAVKAKAVKKVAKAAASKNGAKSKPAAKVAAKPKAGAKAAAKSKVGAKAAAKPKAAPKAAAKSASNPKAANPKAAAPKVATPKAATAKAADKPKAVAAPKAAPAPKAAAAPRVSAPKAVADKPAAKVAAPPSAGVVEPEKKRGRRARPRILSNGVPAAAWLSTEKPRPASFIPAPPRAEAPSAVAAPPASSDRLIRAEDLIDPVIRTVPVRIDIEQTQGRFFVLPNPLMVSVRNAEAIEWDFRYIGGADFAVEEIVIEFVKPAPFPQASYRTRKPGGARPHRQISGPAKGAPGTTAEYVITAITPFKTAVATGKAHVVISE